MSTIKLPTTDSNGNHIEVQLSTVSFEDKQAAQNVTVPIEKEYMTAENVNELKNAININATNLGSYSTHVTDKLDELEQAANLTEAQEEIILNRIDEINDRLREIENAEEEPSEPEPVHGAVVDINSNTSTTSTITRYVGAALDVLLCTCKATNLSSTSTTDLGMTMTNLTTFTDHGINIVRSTAPNGYVQIKLRGTPYSSFNATSTINITANNCEPYVITLRLTVSNDSITFKDSSGTTINEINIEKNVGESFQTTIIASSASNRNVELNDNFTNDYFSLERTDTNLYTFKSKSTEIPKGTYSFNVVFVVKSGNLAVVSKTLSIKVTYVQIEPEPIPTPTEELKIVIDGSIRSSKTITSYAGSAITNIIFSVYQNTTATMTATNTPAGIYIRELESGHQWELHGTPSNTLNNHTMTVAFSSDDYISTSITFIFNVAEQPSIVYNGPSPITLTAYEGTVVGTTLQFEPFATVNNAVVNFSLSNSIINYVNTTYNASLEEYVVSTKAEADPITANGNVTFTATGCEDVVVPINVTIKEIPDIQFPDENFTTENETFVFTFDIPKVNGVTPSVSVVSASHITYRSATKTLTFTNLEVGVPITARYKVSVGNYISPYHTITVTRIAAPAFEITIDVSRTDSSIEHLAIDSNNQSELSLVASDRLIQLISINGTMSDSDSPTTVNVIESNLPPQLIIDENSGTAGLPLAINRTSSDEDYVVGDSYSIIFSITQDDHTSPQYTLNIIVDEIQGEIIINGMKTNHLCKANDDFSFSIPGSCLTATNGKPISLRVENDNSITAQNKNDKFVFNGTEPRDDGVVETITVIASAAGCDDVSFELELTFTDNPINLSLNKRGNRSQQVSWYDHLAIENNVEDPTHFKYKVKDFTEIRDEQTDEDPYTFFKNMSVEVYVYLEAIGVDTITQLPNYSNGYDIWCPNIGNITFVDAKTPEQEFRFNYEDLDDQNDVPDYSYTQYDSAHIFKGKSVFRLYSLYPRYTGLYRITLINAEDHLDNIDTYYEIILSKAPLNKIASIDSDDPEKRNMPTTKRDGTFDDPIFLHEVQDTTLYNPKERIFYSNFYEVNAIENNTLCMYCYMKANIDYNIELVLMASNPNDRMARRVKSFSYATNSYLYYGYSHSNEADIPEEKFTYGSATANMQESFATGMNETLNRKNIITIYDRNGNLCYSTPEYNDESNTIINEELKKSEYGDKSNITTTDHSLTEIARIKRIQYGNKFTPSKTGWYIIALTAKQTKILGRSLRYGVSDTDVDSLNYGEVKKGTIGGGNPYKNLPTYISEELPYTSDNYENEYAADVYYVNASVLHSYAYNVAINNIKKRLSMYCAIGVSSNDSTVENNICKNNFTAYDRSNNLFTAIEKEYTELKNNNQEFQRRIININEIDTVLINEHFYPILSGISLSSWTEDTAYLKNDMCNDNYVVYINPSLNRPPLRLNKYGKVNHMYNTSSVRRGSIFSYYVQYEAQYDSDYWCISDTFDRTSTENVLYQPTMLNNKYQRCLALSNVDARKFIMPLAMDQVIMQPSFITADRFTITSFDTMSTDINEYEHDMDDADTYNKLINGNVTYGPYYDSTYLTGSLGFTQIQVVNVLSTDYDYKGDISLVPETVSSMFFNFTPSASLAYAIGYSNNTASFTLSQYGVSIVRIPTPAHQPYIYKKNRIMKFPHLSGIFNNNPVYMVPYFVSNLRIDEKYDEWYSYICNKAENDGTATIDMPSGFDHVRCIYDDNPISSLMFAGHLITNKKELLSTYMTEEQLNEVTLNQDEFIAWKRYGRLTDGYNVDVDDNKISDGDVYMGYMTKGTRREYIRNFNIKRYNSSTINNDIALIYLSGTLVPDSTAQLMQIHGSDQWENRWYKVLLPTSTGGMKRYQLQGYATGLSNEDSISPEEDPLTRFFRVSLDTMAPDDLTDEEIWTMRFFNEHGATAEQYINFGTNTGFKRSANSTEIMQEDDGTAQFRGTFEQTYYINK